MSLGPAVLSVGGGMYSALSTLNTTTEVPLSKAPKPQLLCRRRSINGCPLLRVCVFTAVCVHLGWLNAEHKFRVWVTILGRMPHHFHGYVATQRICSLSKFNKQLKQYLNTTYLNMSLSSLTFLLD